MVCRRRRPTFVQFPILQLRQWMPDRHPSISGSIRSRIEDEPMQNRQHPSRGLQCPPLASNHLMTSRLLRFSAESGNHVDYSTPPAGLATRARNRRTSRRERRTVQGIRDFCGCRGRGRHSTWSGILSVVWGQAKGRVRAGTLNKLTTVRGWFTENAAIMGGGLQEANRGYERNSGVD